MGISLRINKNNIYIFLNHLFPFFFFKKFIAFFVGLLGTLREGDYDIM